MTVHEMCTECDIERTECDIERTECIRGIECILWHRKSFQSVQSVQSFQSQQMSTRKSPKTCPDQCTAYNVLSLCLTNPASGLLGSFIARTRVISRDINALTAKTDLKPVYANTIEVCDTECFEMY